LTGEDIGRNKFSKLGFSVIEKLIVRFADNTIFCTQNASIVAKAKYSKYSNKIDFVYPGSFPVDIKKISQFSSEAKLKVIYLGSLYQTRNFDTLMDALRLISKEYDLSKKIQIDIFGNMDNDIKNRINQFEFPIIFKHGLVSRIEALKEAKESDVLLLIQNNDLRSSVTIPFKIYDYLNLKIPILGLIFKNSELEEILTTHGHLACQVDDIYQIKESILNLLLNYDQLYSGIRESILTPDLAVSQMLTIVNENH
jgi:glycosyltransferase involved in cell wall biosynthesis